MDNAEHRVLAYVKERSGDVVMLDVLVQHLTDFPVRPTVYGLVSRGYLQPIIYKQFPGFILTEKGHRHFLPMQKRMIAWISENWLMIVSTIAALVAAATGIISLWGSWRDF